MSFFQNPAAEHINAVEAKEAAERFAKQQQTDRVAQIGLLQRTIADAERRKTDPIFINEEAEGIFVAMKNNVDRLAADYERSLAQARQSASPCLLQLDSEGANAYFFKETILAKLPELADRISSRNGLGSGLVESKRAAVVSKCDVVIAEAKAKLETLE
jgi:hypothetical protein